MAFQNVFLSKNLADACDFSYIALRYFNACGAHPSGEIGENHEPETHLIPNILKVAKGEFKELIIYGDNYSTSDDTCVRDYVHVQDLCRAHFLALKALNKGMKRGVFNLGNAKGYSVKQVLRIVEEVTGKKVNSGVVSRREGDQPQLIPSADKVKEILGWVPRYDLRDIIKTAWE